MMLFDEAQSIAREWQSPGEIGRELAAFASRGWIADVAALMDDVDATLSELEAQLGGFDESNCFMASDLWRLRAWLEEEFDVSEGREPW